MADTFTGEYNLTKPAVGGDPNTWGTIWNANADAIDQGMADARFKRAVVDSGAVNAMVAVYRPVIAPGSMADQDEFLITPSFTNTAAVTLNVDGTARAVIGQAGAALPAGAITVNVPCRVKYNAATSNFTLFESSPSMAIPLSLLTQVIWTYAGTIASIPPRFHLCDGTNGTTDLRSLFIVGAAVDASPATGQYKVGDTGGANTVILTADQHAAHTHVISDGGHRHGISDPGHAHGVGDPGHAHNYAGATSVGSVAPFAGGGGFPSIPQPTNNTGGTAGAGTGIFIGAAGTGISTVAAVTGVTAQNQGSNNPHENRPPYFAKAFIQFIG